MPRRPSISTTHSRHEPNALIELVAHSFGTSIPARLAARITDVPAGTVTGKPSTVSVTKTSLFASGVPWSRSSHGMMKSFMSLLPPAGGGAENDHFSAGNF